MKMPNYLRYFHEFVNFLECNAMPANVRELFSLIQHSGSI